MSVVGNVSPQQAATDDGDEWETADLASINVARSETTRSNTESDDVDAATATAFGSLRLMAPPPAQDGGSFTVLDPFARTRQPSPHQHHARYDPNGTYAQPVSPATATAAVARFGPLDPVLLAGLENPRERLSLLKFEDQIVRFVRNPREMQLSFPPLSSYHRLIIHRLADRCGLEHQTADYSPYATQGYDGNASRVVTLFKTAHTTIPRVLLIDLSADKQQPAVTPATAPKIMLRKRAPTRGAQNGGRGDNDSAKNQQRTIEDRERAYAEARARIFGEESASSTTTESSSASSSDDTKPATKSGSTTPTTATPRLGGGYQASGPDGSRGFARDARTNTRQAPPSSPSPNANSDGADLAVKPAAQTDSNHKPQQNWKESKVLWRNREQELNDPDFTRNHDAYRPSRDSQYGANARYGGGNTNQQAYNYDGARSFSYQGGRGRGNDYSRIDPSQRYATPEYFRHPGAIQPPPPPPPPPGGYSAFSPHGRGGYASYPSSQPSQARRGPAQPSPQASGYNDEFPPLGK